MGSGFTVRRGAAVRAGVGAVLMVLFWAQSGRAEIIDRILAVVARELVTLSDVSAALRLGLVPAPAAGADPIRVTLDALILRELELAEANRYQPPEPAPAQIAARFDAIQARFGAGPPFDRLLALAGLTVDQLRLRLRDDLRIEAYLDQRFGVVQQPSEPDVLRYYREHETDFTTSAGLRPFAEVRDEARARWMAAQRGAVIAEWLEGLRRRTEVIDLYVVAP